MAPTHIVFLNGLDQMFAPIVNGCVTIPEGLSGQVYALATTSGSAATEDVIVAGPAILLYEMDSEGNLIQ